MNSKLVTTFCLCLLLVGCRSTQETIDPQIQPVVQDSYIKRLPSAFSPLIAEEQAQSWSQEYQIGLAFAEKLDLYQALTAFKRAEILLADQSPTRKLEIQYHELLCYYLGGKYNESIYAFESTALKYTNKDFPPFRDLLIIMHDVYEKAGQFKKAEGIAELITYYYPEAEEKLSVSTALLKGDVPAARMLTVKYPQNETLQNVIHTYDSEKKSTGKAQLFNALIPGSGYLYLGQKQSAITAFLLNSLFVAATYEFFHHGYTAAGAICASLETGWYVGGIYGAGQETKLYNERIYEHTAAPVLYQEKIFPVLMVQYAF